MFIYTFRDLLPSSSSFHLLSVSPQVEAQTYSIIASVPIITPISKNQCNLHFTGSLHFMRAQWNKKQQWKKNYTCSSSCVFNGTRRSYSPLLAVNLVITAWCFRCSKLWGERCQAATFHLFVLMRKILLIRYVIAETLLPTCVSLCIHLVHSVWEGHNLAACVVPTYIIFPSPFSIHWAARLTLGVVFFCH